MPADPPVPLAPILSGPPLRAFLDRARARRARIVFTNGCFDLVHPGHLAYLEQARLLGDLLLVGLNTDSSVRRIKGEGRPLIPQEGRARLLASLRFVDAVIPFDEETPLRLILLVRPDVLAKGGDYAREQIVGASEVEGWGGEVAILPHVGGYSSSELLRNLRNL